MNSGLLKNKTIVITGASQGIGYAVSQACAAEGARLILISRNPKDLKKAASALPGGPHEAYAMDVSSEDEAKKFYSYLKKKSDTLDGLVNCAGVYGPIGKTEEVSPAEFKKAIEINLVGTFQMCHFLLPLLKKSSRGKIANYSGGGAAGPFPCYSAYAASKAAVVRLTENMAIEYPGLDINAVGPGFVVTRLHDQTILAGLRAGKEFLESTKKQMEKGGVPPEKAARLTVFLMSGKSDGLSGKFISAPWDPWEEASFSDWLKSDKDAATLRRIDQKTFFKKA